MRVAVIGGGAIGAIVSAAAHPGALLCVRTPVESLSVENVADGRSFSPDVRIATSPAEVDGPAEVVFLTVKATDTASAAGWLRALCGPTTVLVLVQNGLDHASRVAGLVPEGTRAVPGLAYVAAEKLAAGHVRHLAGSLLVVPSAVMATVAAVVPGLKIRGTDDVTTACWQKLMGNLVANPLTALTMRRITVMASPGMAELGRGLLEEAVAVGSASGANLDRSLIPAIVEGTARYGADTGSSMLYDRLAGRRLEHQYLTGEVVRRGQALGIPVPLNSAVLALLEAIDEELRRGEQT